MPKRLCYFNNELLNEYPFLKTVCCPDNQVKCIPCGSEFLVAHGGKLI